MRSAVSQLPDDLKRQKLVRVRLAAKVTFGDDSSQYELFGGTRRSNRKPRTRKAVTA